MQRGEIWRAALPDPAGSKPGYRRPVLVVQSDPFTQSAIKTVVCAAITSRENRQKRYAPARSEVAP